MYMIVFEQAYTTICIQVKIDKIYLKYSLIMYELSSGYLWGIFGIKECDLYAPKKRPIRCTEKANRFNGETKRFTRSIAPTSATDYL